ncbi:MAG: hypothetical protein KIT16_03945 [Rhodospirillaceae bacterium]|nr:hypothetical protein [Rhodospirillaceae bacterium]
MRALLRAFAGLLVVFATAGCFLETETALSDPDPKAMDQRLVGTWYHASEGEVVLFAVAADQEKEGAYRVVYTTIKPGGSSPVETAYYSVWRTVLNGHAYLNVKRTGGTGLPQPAMTIVSYDIDAEGRLVLRLMDVKRAIAAIEAGKLKGRFKKDRYVDEATITSPRAELAAFIAGADREALFANKASPLVKLKETKN